MQSPQTIVAREFHSPFQESLQGTAEQETFLFTANVSLLARQVDQCPARVHRPLAPETDLEKHSEKEEFIMTFLGHCRAVQLSFSSAVQLRKG